MGLLIDQLHKTSSESSNENKKYKQQQTNKELLFLLNHTKTHTHTRPNYQLTTNNMNQCTLPLYSPPSTLVRPDTSKPLL
mmetsp:Transcript_21130/g.58784  ORF Transcript_21130/g.58784 Transcript_21130/m.58784 type:complete len:80 (-) Transcript_21130:83-322(-)